MQFTVELPFCSKQILNNQVQQTGLELFIEKIFNFLQKENELFMLCQHIRTCAAIKKIKKKRSSGDH
jgi:hypothetical protein